MGTNGIVMRSMPDHTYQAIRFSYDGYMSHQGPTLVKGYATPDRIERLFAVCGNGITLEENPDHLEVDEDDGMFEADLGRLTRDDARSIVESYGYMPHDHAAPYDAVVCFHHNGAWHAVTTPDVFDAIEQGDTSCMLTEANLIAWSKGELTAANFVAQPPAALAWNERQGFLRLNPDDTLALETGGERWGLSWDDALDSALGALIDREVVIRTGMMASSAGTDAQGRFTTSVVAEVTKVRPA